MPAPDHSECGCEQGESCYICNPELATALEITQDQQQRMTTADAILSSIESRCTPCDCAAEIRSARKVLNGVTEDEQVPDRPKSVQQALDAWYAARDAMHRLEHDAPVGGPSSIAGQFRDADATLQAAGDDLYAAMKEARS